MTSPKKNLTSKTFQFLLMQTRRHVALFEGLNSSPVQLAGKLWSCTVVWK